VARGDGSTYHYDRAGRLARLEHPDGTALRYHYDRDGLLAVERGPDGIRHFRYDEGGRVVAVTVDGVGTTTYAYDDVGRRVGEAHPDGTTVTYEWAGLSRLVAIDRVDRDGAHHRIPIVSDAFGRPVRIGDEPAVRSPAPGHLAGGAPPDGTRVGGLTLRGARVHDAATRQFLSPDPLLPLPGTPGAASSYTSVWHDPINFVDPSGRRPIGVDEWHAIRAREEQGRIGQFAEAIADDPWAGLTALGVTAVGVGLCFSPFAPVGAGILIGVGSSAASGFATGTFDPLDAVIAGVVGGFGGGLAHAGRAGLVTARGAIAAHGAVGASEEFARQTLAGEGYDLTDIAGGGAAGMVSGGCGEYFDVRTMTGSVVAGAGSDGLGNVVGQTIAGNGFRASEVVVSAGTGALGGLGGHAADAVLAASDSQLGVDVLGDGPRAVIDPSATRVATRGPGERLRASSASSTVDGDSHPFVLRP